VSTLKEIGGEDVLGLEAGENPGPAGKSGRSVSVELWLRWRRGAAGDGEVESSIRPLSTAVSGSVVARCSTCGRCRADETGVAMDEGESRHNLVLSLLATSTLL